MLAAAATRRDVLAGLSPAMKEEVKRFVEPALVRRARGAITRAFAGLEYTLDGAGYVPVHGEQSAPATVHDRHLTGRPQRVIPLSRTRSRGATYLAHLVAAEPWA